MLHAVVLFAVVVSLGPIAAVVPHAVLAGILVKVGYDIIDLNYLQRAHKGPRWDFLLMLLVLGLTVFVDLISAVVIGVMLASLAYVKRTGDNQIGSFNAVPAPLPVADRSAEESAMVEAVAEHVTLINIAGALSFNAAADLSHHVRKLSNKTCLTIILDFSQVPFVDLSAALAIEAVIKDAQNVQRNIYAVGMNQAVGKVLKRFSAEYRLADDACFEYRIDALQAAMCVARKNLSVIL